MRNINNTVPLTIFFAAGGIILAGGWNGTHALSSTEGLGMEALPAIPVALKNFPLVLVKRTLYLCGGFPTTSRCYILDIEEASPTWRETTGLPKAMYRQTGVVMGTHIWYVYGSTLFEYNTVTGTTELHTMPFTQAWVHCAVANATHSYVAGVGSNRDEIWLNEIAGDPSQWTMVIKLPSSTRHLSCVWFQGTIHIQGGWDSLGYPRKDAFVLDVHSNSLRRVANMTTARRGGKAAIVDCKPAMIGGKTTGGRYLTSIETFNGTDWTLHEMSLETARVDYGLVQFYN